MTVHTENEALFQRASRCLAGGVLSNFKKAKGVAPVYVKSAEGCRMTDAAAGFTYGAYGYAVKLFNLPLTLVVAIGVSIIPAISGALALALGIGLQNIPEGAAVSLPLVQAGQGRRKAFCAGAASGLVEPLGALLALALAGWVSAALPWLMSAAAGCMVCVTAQEMIPEAVEQDEPAGVISVVLGFALMMALDIAL